MRKFGPGGAILLALLIAARWNGQRRVRPPNPPPEAPPSPAATNATHHTPRGTPSAAPNSAADEQAGERTLLPTWTPRAFSQPTASPRRPPTRRRSQPRNPRSRRCPTGATPCKRSRRRWLPITGHPVRLRWAELENVALSRGTDQRHRLCRWCRGGRRARIHIPRRSVCDAGGVWSGKLRPVDTAARTFAAISNEIVVRVPPD